jgi:hypothetical protein
MFSFSNDWVPIYPATPTIQKNGTCPPQPFIPILLVQAEKMRTGLRKLALNLEIVGHTTAAIWLFA